MSKNKKSKKIKNFEENLKIESSKKKVDFN